MWFLFQGDILQQPKHDVPFTLAVWKEEFKEDVKEKAQI